MKVILKGGSKEKNEEIKRFFLHFIFPILESGIVIEPSDRVVTFYKKKDGKIVEYVDPTAEVIVELSYKAIILAQDLFISDDNLKKISGRFFDEAKAIVEITKLGPAFSLEYYSCCYSPPAKAKQLKSGYQSIESAPEGREISVMWGSIAHPEYGNAIRHGNIWYNRSNPGKFSYGQLCTKPIAWHPEQTEGL